MVSDATTAPTVLGWPIYENGSMEGTLTGSAADYTVVPATSRSTASWTGWERRSRSCRNVLGTNHRPTGQLGFYMHFGVGADCLTPDAFRLTNHSA